MRLSLNVGNPIGLTRLQAGLGFAILLLILTACISGESGGEPEPDLPPSATIPAPSAVEGTVTFTPANPSATPLVRPTTTVRPTATPIPDAVTAAIAEVAAERGIHTSEVVLLQYEEARWPSTALGCPVPGNSYAQIVTSGYSLHLSILGQVSVYHVDLAGTTLVACEGGELEP